MICLDGTLDLREVANITCTNISLILANSGIIAYERAVQELEYQIMVFVLSIVQWIRNLWSVSDDTNIDTPSANSHRDAIFIHIDSNKVYDKKSSDDRSRKEYFFAKSDKIQFHKSE